mmetsp:Transcript_54216/g.172088  ORF Transcript_54216/g.172088 Transcript_54216/m.172088 type:complete len:249 (-) Transcript_54216:1389-2135(-)
MLPRPAAAGVNGSTKDWVTPFRRGEPCLNNIGEIGLLATGRSNHSALALSLQLLVGLVVREDEVEDERKEGADAIGRLDDKDHGVTPRFDAVVIVQATTGLVLHHLRNRRGVDAAEGGAHIAAEGVGGAVDEARLRGNCFRHHGEGVAVLFAGPQAHVVLAVSAVEPGEAAALGEVGLAGDTDADAERDGEDEAVAAGHGLLGNDRHARNHHVSEQEDRHAAEHAVGDGGDHTSELPEDTEENQPDGA